MMDHIQYKTQILTIIDSNIKVEYGVFLFGSRAKKQNQIFSDIDLGIIANSPLDRRILFQIEDDLRESTIPFKIDIIDFMTTTQDFNKISLEKIVVWKNSPQIKSLLESTMN